MQGNHGILDASAYREGLSKIAYHLHNKVNDTLCCNKTSCQNFIHRESSSHDTVNLAGSLRSSGGNTSDSILWRTRVGPFVRSFQGSYWVDALCAWAWVQCRRLGEEPRPFVLVLPLTKRAPYRLTRKKYLPFLKPTNDEIKTCGNFLWHMHIYVTHVLSWE